MYREGILTLNHIYFIVVGFKYVLKKRHHITWVIVFVYTHCATHTYILKNF